MGETTRYISQKRLERRAEELIAKFDIDEPPVPVESVAGDLGLTVEYTELGEGVSGLLVMSGKTGTIGVNKRDPRVRQRFSIAHEIGHYTLHVASDDAVFIDKDYALFRDNRASEGEIREEIQANMFAAALLMPASLLKQRMDQGEIDLGDDDQMNELAKLFEVSVAAIAYRITNLTNRRE